MKQARLIATLVGVATIAVCAADASAMFHPVTGRFLQADPGVGGVMAAGQFIPRDQYRDGMNLYQYVRSHPTIAIDPSGLRVFPSSIVTDIDGNLRDMLYAGETAIWNRYSGVLNDKEIAVKVLYEFGKRQFNPMDDLGANKFVFTCKYGWMDLGHFFLSAWYAFEHSGSAREGYGGGLAVERTQQILAAMGDSGSAGSAWSVEDLPSDYHGALFGQRVYGMSLDILLNGSRSQHWQQWRGPRAPISVMMLLWLRYDAKDVDEGFYLPRKGNWVRKILERDADAPRWVGGGNVIMPEAATAGRGYDTAIQFQRAGAAFQCLCNPDGTRKEFVQGAREDCPCGIDVSKERPR